jgi:beta-1,4-mannosyl-glycoprotein beta-1,4-N-acetylglucosaminyltransferase
MPKVWDCFLFNDELDLLSFRLSELDQCVDTFVIVEATTTFRGEPKPLYYADHQSRYEQFSAKIRHIVVSDMPDVVDTLWERERHQHAAILKGLFDVEPDDLVIVGDLDEIPRRDVIKELLLNLSEPTRLVLNHSIYFANWQLPIQWSDASMICRGNQLEEPSMAFLLGRPSENASSPRQEHHRKWEVSHASTVKRLENAGWHLSYMGGIDAINKKLGEFSHSELDIPKVRDSKYLENCMRLGVDFKGKFILKRLDKTELEPMLQRLEAQWPETFLFPKHRNALTALLAIVYRRYARLRFLYELPSQFSQFIDSHVIVSLLVLAVPMMLYEFGGHAKERIKDTITNLQKSSTKPLSSA